MASSRGGWRGNNRNPHDVDNKYQPAETWPPNAWYVASGNSDTDSNPKTERYFVRAVRSGP